MTAPAQCGCGCCADAVAREATGRNVFTACNCPDVPDPLRCDCPFCTHVLAGLTEVVAHG